MSEVQTLTVLIEQVEEMLTDSAHPLDEKQARVMSLMLQQHTAMAIQSLFNELLEARREIVDWRTNVSDRRREVNERLSVIEKVIVDLPEIKRTVGELKRTMDEYPSLTWLLRFRTTPTVRWIALVLFLLYVVYRSYPTAATWFGLPPLP